MIAIVVEPSEIVRGFIAEVVRKYRLDINKWKDNGACVSSF
jgi:hypothetical protein